MADYSLSGIDIDRILSANDCPHDIITYRDLARKIRRNEWTFDNLLPDHVLVICFETKPQYGHWICVFSNYEGIQFFDSYGLSVDDEQHWNFDPEFKKYALEDYPWLLRCLYQSGHVVNYNQYVFQAHNPMIRTCGRWVCLRACTRYLGCDEFACLISDQCAAEGKDPDQLVVEKVPV